MAVLSAGMAKTYAHKTDLWSTPVTAYEALRSALLDAGWRPNAVVLDPFHDDRGGEDRMRQVFGDTAAQLDRSRDAFELTTDDPLVKAADLIVTNVPFSCKIKALDLLCRLGRPFAALMPLDAIGNKNFRRLPGHKTFQTVLLDGRQKFVGVPGAPTGACPFNCCWVGKDLHLARDMVWA